MKVISFVRKYNGRTLEDDGAYNSSEFVQFAKDLKATIREVCKDNNAKLTNFSVGHYDVSGFIIKDGKYVYFSYSEPRGCAIDFNKSDYANAFLIRTAEHNRDYRGGGNHFCNIFHFAEMLNKLTA